MTSPIFDPALAELGVVSALAARTARGDAGPVAGLLSRLKVRIRRVHGLSGDAGAGSGHEYFKNRCTEVYAGVRRCTEVCAVVFKSCLASFPPPKPPLGDQINLLGGIRLFL